MRCSLCAHIEPLPATFSKKSKNLTTNFWRPQSPSCAHGRFHRMRAFVARRAPNFPPQASVVGVFWCHLCSTEQAAAAKERQCGTAGQQHRPSDTWQTSQSNTSSPAVGTTSSVINQTARRHIRRPRRPRPTARRHHGPPDPCARAGAGDRRCVVHIPQRRGECFCTVCCLEFARAPRAVATAPPSRRRPGRWCGVWRLHAGVQVWRLWVVRARQEGAFQALPPCTNLTALIDLCLNGAPP